MPLDTDVQELLDRARMSDTIYAFCDYCNSGDVESVVQLFAENGLMDLGGGAVHVGHSELREMFTDRFALYKATTFHCSGVRLVRYDGQSASTTTYLYGIHDAAALDRQMHVWGRYEDEMIKDHGVWRFLRRDLWVSGLSHTAIDEVPERFVRSDHAHGRSGQDRAVKSGSAQRSLPVRPDLEQPVSVITPGRLKGPNPVRQLRTGAPQT